MFFRDNLIVLLQNLVQIFSETSPFEFMIRCQIRVLGIRIAGDNFKSYYLLSSDPTIKANFFSVEVYPPYNDVIFCFGVLFLWITIGPVVGWRIGGCFLCHFDIYFGIVYFYVKFIGMMGLEVCMIQFEWNSQITLNSATL